MRGLKYTEQEQYIDNDIKYKYFYVDQGYKDNYCIFGAYLSLAYARQRKPVFLY